MPAEFAAVADWLNGIAISRHELESEAFGDRLIEYRMHGFGVRLVRDRGQWRIEIGDEALGWFDIGVWDAYLTGVTPANVAPTAAQQAAFLRERLSAVEQAVHGDRNLREHLSTLGWNRNRSILGLPPAPPPRATGR
jgi:hypothetical protein